MPEGVDCDADLWASCIGGAMQVDAYREAIEGSGCGSTTARTPTGSSPTGPGTPPKYGVKSISLLARRR